MPPNAFPSPCADLCLASDSFYITISKIVALLNSTSLSYNLIQRSLLFFLLVFLGQHTTTWSVSRTREFSALLTLLIEFWVHCHYLYEAIRCTKFVCPMDSHYGFTVTVNMHILFVSLSLSLSLCLYPFTSLEFHPLFSEIIFWTQFVS